MVSKFRFLPGALLGAVVALIGAASLAQAQYYPPGPGYYGPRGGGYYEDRSYRRGYDRPPPGYYRERRDPYGGGYGRRANMGRMCITSRGPCGVERFQPIGSSCRCQIQGLKKGGYIGY